MCGKKDKMGQSRENRTKKPNRINQIEMKQKIQPAGALEKKSLKNKRRQEHEPHQAERSA